MKRYQRPTAASKAKLRDPVVKEHKPTRTGKPKSASAASNAGVAAAKQIRTVKKASSSIQLAADVAIVPSVEIAALAPSAEMVVELVVPEAPHVALAPEQIVDAPKCEVAVESTALENSVGVFGKVVEQRIEELEKDIKCSDLTGAKSGINGLTPELFEELSPRSTPTAVIGTPEPSTPNDEHNKALDDKFVALQACISKLEKQAESNNEELEQLKTLVAAQGEEIAALKQAIQAKSQLVTVAAQTDGAFSPDDEVILLDDSFDKELSSWAKELLDQLEMNRANLTFAIELKFPIDGLPPPAIISGFRLDPSPSNAIACVGPSVNERFRPYLELKKQEAKAILRAEEHQRCVLLSTWAEQALLSGLASGRFEIALDIPPPTLTATPGFPAFNIATGRNALVHSRNAREHLDRICARFLLFMLLMGTFEAKKGSQQLRRRRRGQRKKRSPQNFPLQETTLQSSPSWADIVEEELMEISASSKQGATADQLRPQRQLEPELGRTQRTARGQKPRTRRQDPGPWEEEESSLPKTKRENARTDMEGQPGSSSSSRRPGSIKAAVNGGLARRALDGIRLDAVRTAAVRPNLQSREAQSWELSWQEQQQQRQAWDRLRVQQDQQLRNTAGTAAQQQQPQQPAQRRNPTPAGIEASGTRNAERKRQLRVPAS
ncbi:hypothetical protein HDU96_001932 [Phlyctochytrium bullatum]|nr:hypothetical protein HDU96_001932 [Phlyctochytrium bullatum]